MKRRVVKIPILEQVCFGKCDEGVVMRISPRGRLFFHVLVEDIDEVIDKAINFRVQNFDFSESEI